MIEKVLLNIKKLFDLRRKSVRQKIVNPIFIFFIISIATSFGVIAGAKLNEAVCKANGGKMPVYDELATDWSYDDDPKHCKATENTKLPWLADWIELRIDSKLKTVIAVIVGAPRYHANSLPTTVCFLSPGDIVMALFFDSLIIFFSLTVLFYVGIMAKAIFCGPEYLFEDK